MLWPCCPAAAARNDAVAAGVTVNGLPILDQHKDLDATTSGATDFAVRLLARPPYQAPRRVIDVSGNGPNNDAGPGRAPLSPRRRAARRG